MEASKKLKMEMFIAIMIGVNGVIWSLVYATSAIKARAEKKQDGLKKGDETADATK